MIDDMDEIKTSTEKLPYDLILATIVQQNHYRLQWEIQKCTEIGGIVRTPRFAFIAGHPKDWTLSLELKRKGEDKTFHVKLDKLEDKSTVCVRYRMNIFVASGRLQESFEGEGIVCGKRSVELGKFPDFFDQREDKVILKIHFTVYGNDVETCCTSYDVRSQDLGLLNYHQLMKDSNADMTIHVGAESFPVHKSIFRFRAPEFLKKYPDGSEGNTIIVENVDPKEFQQVLMYVYTGDIDAIRLELNTAEVYRAAYVCGIKGLQRKCGNVLAKQISEGTVCEVFTLAKECKDLVLKNVACSFMDENKEVMYKRNDFMKITSQIRMSI